jgi:aldose 1-epimerase
MSPASAASWPVFGRLPDGEAVAQLRIAGGGLQAEILSFGATLRTLAFDGQPVVLSLPALSDYNAGRAYFGAIAGRFANRIAEGRFTLDGTSYQLPCNEAGRTHLHGGQRGFSHRNWQVRGVDPATVMLAYEAADGEEGYPGALSVTCTYAIRPDATLDISLTATSSRPTIINLAAHSYFNLDGGGSIVDHQLEIPADRYLPVDADKIPTGEQAAVAGTPFDFRKQRRIGEHPYDHAFVLSRPADGEPRPVARLCGARSGITLEIASTEPALQFYDGHMLGIGGYGPRDGLCLEPQRYPDAPNHPGFPGAVLRPGETYRQLTRYRFRRSG